MQRIGKYDTLRVLGRGPRSTIYAVQDPYTQEVYAIKHVKREDGDDERFLTQAINEYRVGSKLKHEALRPCFQLRKSRRLLTLTEVLVLMELVEGEPLNQHVPNSLKEVLRIFAVVAEALQEMHTVGYVHADMKPANVLVSRHGRVKVIDYGQSCPINTKKDRVQGTPDYIAPEQVKRRRLTARTDIFSFGASLYWAVTGDYVPTLIPRHDGSEDKRKLVPPIEHNPNLPPALNHLILHCVQREPSHRPEDMEEVGSRLAFIISKLKTDSPARPDKPENRQRAS